MDARRERTLLQMTLQLVLSLITIAGLGLVYYELRKVEPAVLQVGKTAGAANSLLSKLGL